MTPDPPAKGKAFGQFIQSTRQLSETPVTAAMIAELPDSKLDDQVWLRLHSRVDLSSRGDIEALHPLVRAYLVTRMFDWEVGNGGLRQYFLNFEDRPWFLPLVLDGYTTLGLDAQRRLIVEPHRPGRLLGEGKAHPKPGPRRFLRAWPEEVTTR